MDTPTVSHELELPLLSPQAYEALAQSARHHGRTIAEEAEHLIKTHLATLLSEESE
jgi:hypothetical protein